MLQKEMVLMVKDLYVSIGDSPVLQQISFTLTIGQKLAIIGENGAGKSTLLKAIGGLIQIGAGTIVFKGKAIKGPLEQLIPGNAGIAYLSQYFELRNNYIVQDLLQVFNKADTATAAAIYTVCEIYPLMQRRTNELSGGEKQRICLAIALSEKPAVLLLDEPFSNADSIHKQRLKSVIDNIIALFNVTVLLVSHEAADSLSWADELLILDKGAVLQKGSPQEVYYKPRNEWAAGLLGAYNIIRKGSAFWEKYFAALANASKVLVRPNQIQINVNKQGGIEGEVIGYSFNGLYGCYTIQAGEEVFIISTIAEQYKKGQTIQLCPLQNLQYCIIE